MGTIASLQGRRIVCRAGSGGAGVAQGNALAGAVMAVLSIALVAGATRTVPLREAAP